MEIISFMSEDSVIVDMKKSEKKEALKELLNLLEKNGHVSNSEEILDSIMDREKLGSTGIGQGIAVPHAKTDSITELVGAIGISKQGVAFDSLDGEPVHIIFLILAPNNSIGLHLKALAKIARLLKDKTFRNALRNATNPAEVIKVIKEDEEKLSSIS